MSSVSRKKDRVRLEGELQGQGYGKLLRGLQERAPFLKRFPSWAEVLAFMQEEASHDPAKDEVLCAIFQARSEDRDARWNTVLLTMFWPGLQSIRHQKRHWDRDSAEFWQAIVCAFLDVVSRLDLKKRPTRLASKLCCETIHRLHDLYRKIWDQAAFEIPTDPQILDSFPSDTWEAAVAKVRAREDEEAEVERLRRHMLAGRLGKEDFALLVATRVHGQSLADYARQAGLGYQVAKKRRQRAEAALRRFEGGER